MVDDKPMVIHTKKKAKLHTHEPKKASIKASNIYTVDRSPKIKGFVRNIMDNVLYQNAYDELAENVDKTLRFIKQIRENLAKDSSKEQLDMADILACDAFKGIDEIIIDWMLERLNDEILDTQIDGLNMEQIVQRRLSDSFHYGKHFKNEYQVLKYAYLMMKSIDKLDISTDVVTMVKNYQEKNYLIDSYYRWFYFAFDQLSDNDKFMKLRERIENIYANDYLMNSLPKWNNLYTGQAVESLGLVRQQEFYRHFLRPYEGGDRVIVIISDALRYECAKELMQRFEYDEKCEAKMDTMLGVLPSVTSLGMASLLPHTEINVDKDMNVTVDGSSCSDLVSRDKILKAKNTDNVAVSFDDIAKANKATVRELLQGRKIVYIYHNQVDARGDKAASENEVFNACAEAIDEIIRLIRKLTGDISATKYMEQLFPILGIRFISVNDCYDSDMLEDGEIGGLDISFKNLIYDYYARETSKKEKLAWKKSAERGDYRACVTLYGYRKSKDNHFKLEIDPEAAKIVREIFSMKLSGMTSTEIAANLNARNILPPTEYKYQAGDKRAVNTNTRKCFWEAGVVNGILQNEKYTGDMVLLKTEVNRVTGKQVKRAKEDWITVENTHEAIVSREVFEAVAKTIKTVTRSFGKNINVFYCSGCGRKMIACRGAILKCRINVTVTDSRKCVDTTISVKKAEQSILADIKLKCSTFIDMRAAMKSACGNNEKSLEERICSIEKTMEYIDSAWKNIYSEYADRKISKEEYMIQSQEHKQKKQALAEELDRLKTELKQCKADGTKNSIEVLLQKFRDADELTNEMKEKMIEKVIVYPNNALEIYWKPDFAKFFETTNMIIRKEKDRK